MKRAYFVCVLALMSLCPNSYGLSIDSFSPIYGRVSDPIVIEGSGFVQNGTVVRFNGVVAQSAVTSLQPPQITAFVPVGATRGKISLTTAAGTVLSGVDFTVIGNGPYIFSFSPTTGGAGTIVTLTGANMPKVTAVQFNGTTAGFEPAVSDDILRILAPAGVSSGPIKVISPQGTFTTSSNFFAPPQITSATPVQGRRGTNVIILGKNLLGVQSVTFNGVASTVFSNRSGTEISAIVPPLTSTGPLLVRTPAGSAILSNYFVVRPNLTNVSLIAASPGTQVTLTGENLEGLRKVEFNGTAASVVQSNSTSVRVIVPENAASGPILVTTTNGTTLSSGNFYLPAQITTLTPKGGPSGTSVTISGKNFTNATSVKFNGVAVQSFTVVNNLTITTKVPSGVTSGFVSVTTPAGTANNTVHFHLPPVISNFSPRNGLPGTNVVISGANFLSTTKVLFNGVAAVTPAITASNINVRVPTGATSGPISVQNEGGTTVSTEIFTLSALSDVSVSLSTTTNVVQAGADLTYLLSITNKGPSSTRVTVTNRLPASATFKSLQSTSGNFSRLGGLVFGSIESLPKDGSLRITIVVTPEIEGSLTNTAEIFSESFDSDLGNNKATLVTRVSALGEIFIDHTGTGQISISWPAHLENFVLEKTTSLGASAGWLTVPGPYNIEGDFKVVRENAGSKSVYYRLRSGAP